MSRGLTLEGLADFERSKRHPNALRAERLRDRKRREATGEPYRTAENAGQGVLDFEVKR